jgi:hypothetical protein
VDVPAVEDQQLGVDVEILLGLSAQLADGDTMAVHFRASASGGADGIILCSETAPPYGQIAARHHGSVT